MTGEDFVKLCYKEKESMMQGYFAEDSESEAAMIIKEMIQSGASREDLYRLVNTILTDNYYTLLLGIDGACSLGDQQVMYKLYDEDENLLNECGEIEESAYSYFMQD